MQGGSTDFLRAITIDNQDNLYVIGSFVNHIDFGEDTLSSFGNRGKYLFLNSTHRIIIVDGSGDVKHQNHLDMLVLKLVAGVLTDSAE